MDEKQNLDKAILVLAVLIVLIGLRRRINSFGRKLRG